MSTLLVLVVVAALAFDFTNGFHDSANAIATSISTRALRPRVAVVFAAVLNFVGALVSVEVAATVATGIVEADLVTLDVVFAALVGAITWNLVTWYFGLPSSSSHSLIGGVIGASVAANGFGVVAYGTVATRVALPSLLAPLAAVALAALIVIAILWTFARADRVRANHVGRRLQIVSAGFVAFTHGTNDAQKTMGIVTLALISAGEMSSADFHVPLWVMLASASVMALGTYIGGWRIIRTLGTRVVHLDPHQGFAAETATAAILFVTAQSGAPVSTTHTISGGVLGSGAAHSIHAVRWRVATNIVAAWVLTIPAAAAVSAAVVLAGAVPGGVVAVAAAGLVGAVLLAAERRRRSRGKAGGRETPPPRPLFAR